MADQRAKTWKGDMSVLPYMMVRVWSKNVAGMPTWSGQECNITSFNEGSGVVSAEISNKTYIFHISTVLLQILDKLKGVDKEIVSEEDELDSRKLDAAKILKSTAKGSRVKNRSSNE